METKSKRPRDNCLYEAALTFLAHAQYEQTQIEEPSSVRSLPSNDMTKPEAKKPRLCDVNHAQSFSLPRTFPSVTPDFPLPSQSPPSSWHEIRAFDKRVRFEPWPTVSIRANAVYKKLNHFLEFNKNKLVSLLPLLDNLSSSVQTKPLVSVQDLIENRIINDAFLIVKEIRANLDKCVFSTDNTPSVVSPCEPLRTELYENFIPSDSYPQKAAIPAPVSVKPTYKIHSIQDERHTLPQASVTTVPPTVSLYPSVPEESDNQNIATAFQTLFDKPADRLSPQESSIVSSLADGIAQALHTRIGLGVIFSHNEALFIEVVGVEPLIRKRIVVRISEPFCCDHKVSTIFGIAAFIEVVELRGATKKLFDPHVVEAMQLISQAAASTISNLCQGHGDSGDPAQESQGDTTLTIKPDKDEQDGPNMSSLRQLCEQNAEKDGNGQNDPLETRGGDLGLYEGQRMEKCLGTGVEAAYMSNENIGTAKYTEFQQWRNDRLVRTLLERSWGVLGSGGCGMVKNGIYRSTKVAIKYWNRRHRSGGELLWREINLYCELATRCSELLGSVMPRLIVVGSQMWVGCVLITEQVGERVKAVYGHIQVGCQNVSKSDVDEIRESAVRGLKRLHTVAGILHRDVELRNLRAERVRENQKAFWRTWWLDFGLAKPCTDVNLMAEEVQHCHRIFDEGYIDA